ncbi:MAG: glycine cleavage system aminomethyltransferase GcvT [Propionibacteriaceae bacterium]|jgi:aminomethyltransferase|nr:glycine cleavage system aminomethyltransferase GcvT [Propionibacteriaceae bacterium]
MSQLLLSPLNDAHVALGAKFAEFSGWNMPLQYGGIVAEHNAVRQAVGIFDVSHLGKAEVLGEGALEFANNCLTNDLNRIQDGQAQYTLICDDEAGVVDDLIAYRVSADEIFLIPNAGNTAEVVRRLSQAAPAGIQVVNRHWDYAVVAVQGPRAAEVLAAVNLPSDLGYMSFVRGVYLDDAVSVCRTGYTGELGYELVVPKANALALWEQLLVAGKPFGLTPAGLGARDTLRTEMGYPLHGHELSTSVNALEAQVGWAVGFAKEAFWGAGVLREIKAAGGPSRKLWGLKSLGKGIPRPGMGVLSDSGETIGEVTSGTFSPTLNVGIALAFLSSALTLGDRVNVQVRSRVEPFEVVKPPFVPSRVR